MTRILNLQKMATVSQDAFADSTSSVAGCACSTSSASSCHPPLVEMAI